MPAGSAGERREEWFEKAHHKYVEAGGSGLKIVIMDIREKRTFQGEVIEHGVAYDTLVSETHTYKLDTGFIVEITQPPQRRIIGTMIPTEKSDNEVAVG